MSNQFHVELVSARNEVVKLEKRIRLLEELVALENEHGETNHHIVATATETPEAPKRRGRPPRQNNSSIASAAKSMTLPSLLISIGSQNPGPLSIAEISQLVDQAGYRSKSEDPGYMIYQSLYKLCKKGVFERDRQEGSYRFLGVEQD